MIKQIASQRRECECNRRVALGAIVDVSCQSRTRVCRAERRVGPARVGKGDRH